MAAKVIHFPRAGDGSYTTTTRERVESEVPLFEINEHGQVDLADGVCVTDAVTQFWELLQSRVTEAWEGHAIGREAARSRLLMAHLDKTQPGWREELAWKG